MRALVRVRWGGGLLISIALPHPGLVLILKESEPGGARARNQRPSYRGDGDAPSN